MRPLGLQRILPWMQDGEALEVRHSALCDEAAAAGVARYERQAETGARGCRLSSAGSGRAVDQESSEKPGNRCSSPRRATPAGWNRCAEERNHDVS